MSAYFVVVVLAGLIAALLATRVSGVKAFAGALGVLYFTGFISTEQVLDKATNLGVVTLIALLLVSLGLEKLTILTTLSNRLMHANLAFSIMRLGLVTAISSAFLNNTAVVATLAGGVQRNHLHRPSKLLIVLSYTAIMGGTMTLIGTSTNLIVNSFLLDAGSSGFALFDFFPIGAAATLAGLLTLAAMTKALPNHTVGDKAITDYLLEAEVTLGSSMVGRSVADNGLRDLNGLFLVEIVRDGQLITPVTPREVLQASDKLIFSGDVTRLHVLDEFDGLRSFAMEEGLLRSNLTEVIVLPGATVEGRTIKASGFRSLFDAAVVGVSRGGLPLSGKLGEIELRAGDSLILAVGPDFRRRNNLRRNFVVVDSKIDSGRVGGVQSASMLFGLAAVVTGAALGWFQLVSGLALLLTFMLAIGSVSVRELRRRFPFDLWLIITSALCVSQALADTGLVSHLVAATQVLSGNLNPMYALIAVYLLSLLMTELMTNTAAAALIFPLAASLAGALNVDVLPFAAAVAFGASASFLTPFGYTTNLMVQNMGGYRVSDYLRIGAPVSLVYTVIALSLIPLVFPF